MKRFLAAAFCVLIGFGLGIAFLGSALLVGAVSPPVASKNGDTNGDGNLDISDAVYLLSFLFSGGPGPAGIQCPATRGLPATGQTVCFGTGSTIDCGHERARGQDAFHQIGCPLEGRFRDNGDGTVSDACTGLMWTKGNVDVDRDREIVIRGPAILRPMSSPWIEACQFADDMTYLGHDDWRVPNANEMLSILTYANSSAANAQPFEHFSFAGSWTSTHLNAPRALGYRLQSASSASCECCILMFAPLDGAQVFTAVRGPVSTP